MTDHLALNRTLGDWAEHAACRGVNPDIFHPADRDYTLALTYCRRCPVRSDCLTHAIEHRERDGMWGGLTERARRRLRSAAHMAPPPDERAARAVDMRRDGVALWDIARALGARFETVKDWLADAGLDDQETA